MKVKDILDLRHGSWVTLRDGRKGRYQEVVEIDLRDGYPSVVVNLPNEDDLYSHNERFFPAQIKCAS